MISIRDKKSPLSDNQNFDVVEISVASKNIPLATENWSERYCTLPKQMKDYIESVQQFAIRDNDVFLITLPKCGTTWMQEAAWLIYNDLDYEQALRTPSNQRCVYLELCGINMNVQMNTIEAAAKLPSPRLIKSHLPANLIPQEIWQKRTKVIYVARNVKDCVVSFYHFLRGKGNWDDTLELFVQGFIKNELAYLPFWSHVMDFWQMRNESNVFFTTYEAMQRDLSSVLSDLSKFLEKPEMTEQQMKKLVNHLSFDNMKSNSKTNPTEHIKAKNNDVLPEFQFMRRGIVGAYKDELPEQCQMDIDKWTEESLKRYNITSADIFGNS